MRLDPLGGDGYVQDLARLVIHGRATLSHGGFVVTLSTSGYGRGMTVIGFRILPAKAHHVPRDPAGDAP